MLTYTFTGAHVRQFPISRDEVANQTRSIFVRVKRYLIKVREQSRQRTLLSELAQLDDHMLRDIGMSRSETDAKLFRNGVLSARTYGLPNTYRC